MYVETGTADKYFENNYPTVQNAVCENHCQLSSTQENTVSDLAIMAQQYSYPAQKEMNKEV